MLPLAPHIQCASCPPCSARGDGFMCCFGHIIADFNKRGDQRFPKAADAAKSLRREAYIMGPAGVKSRRRALAGGGSIIGGHVHASSQHTPTE